VKFAEILRVCALERDLQLFPLGVHSQVGDRGSSLSGGQKARVNLARALYQGGQVMLLDDILSALDPRVGQHVFREAIVKYLGSSLRILATHQVRFLPQADHILLLDKVSLKTCNQFRRHSHSVFYRQFLYSGQSSIPRILRRTSEVRS
jgi:ABC-type transport system involved in cytochrome bd biosynthesis fused ATPase/permease subunit